MDQEQFEIKWKNGNRIMVIEDAVLDGEASFDADLKLKKDSFRKEMKVKDLSFIPTAGFLEKVK